MTLTDPYGAEIIDALDAGTHRLERWNAPKQEWRLYASGPGLRDVFHRNGRSVRQRGFRLVPIEPETERVRLHELVGRRLPSHPGQRITGFTAISSTGPLVVNLHLSRPDDIALGFGSALWNVPVPADGTVEVLKVRNVAEWAEEKARCQLREEWKAHRFAEVYGSTPCTVPSVAEARRSITVGESRGIVEAARQWRRCYNGTDDTYAPSMAGDPAAAASARIRLAAAVDRADG